MITVNKEKFQGILESMLDFTEPKNTEFENFTLDFNETKILIFAEDSQKTRQITSSIDTTSDILHIKTSVQVNAEKIVKCLKSIKAEKIGLEYSASTLKIATAKAVFTLPVSEPMPRELTLSDAEFKAEEMLICEDLVRALNSVIPFTGNISMNMDKIRVEKYLDGVVFVSTNSFVLATYYLPLSYQKFKDTFLRSDLCIGIDEAKALVKVLKLSAKCKIKTTDTELRLYTSDSNTVIRLKDANFPDWASILRDPSKISLIDTAAMKEAIKALKPVASSDSAKIVTLDFEDDLLSLESSSDGYIAEFSLVNKTEFTAEVDLSLESLEKVINCCSDCDFVACDYSNDKDPVIFKVEGVQDRNTDKEKVIFDQEYYIMPIGE